MIDMPALPALLAHLVQFFALFGLPIIGLVAVGAFFIFKDYQAAVDTTSPEDHLHKALADHEAMLTAVEEQNRLAIAHLQQQRERQVYAVQHETIAKLEKLMINCAGDGMPDDLRSACEAVLRIDPKNVKALAYQTSLSA